MKGKWQTIQQLNLRNVGLKTGMVLCLVKADLPLLQDLNLSHNSRLTPEAIGHIASAHWPQLTSLNLASNDLRIAPTKTSKHKDSLSETSSSHCSKGPMAGLGLGDAGCSEEASESSNASEEASESSNASEEASESSDASDGLDGWSKPWQSQRHTVYSENDFQAQTSPYDYPDTDVDSVFSGYFAPVRIVSSEADSEEAEDPTEEELEGVAAIKHLIKAQWPNLVSLSVEKT